MSKEAAIEAYLEVRCTQLGWRCLKLVELGRRGFPDRTILTGEGSASFVEVKDSPDKGLDPLQFRRFKELRSSGHKCYLIGSCKDVDDLIGILIKLHETREAL